MRYRFSDIELDDQIRELVRAGNRLPLEPRTFDLLLYLIRNRDRVVSKDELLDRLWPDEEVMEGALITCVHRARAAVGSRAGDEVIKTFKRRGYRFVAAVEELPSRSGAREPSPAPSSRLVDRRVEIERFRRAVDAAAGGEARVVIMGGEPGIGKTRLLRALSRMARERGFEVLWAEGSLHAGEAPFTLWEEILGSYAAGRNAAEIERAVGSDGRELARLAPGLRSRLGLPTFAQSSGADRDGASPFAAVAGFIGRAAEQHPLALLFDDLHEADADSLHLLRRLIHAIEPLPLLIAAVYRDTAVASKPLLATLVEELTDKARCDATRVGPLDDADAALMLEEIAGGRVSGHVVETIVRRSEGNPLFVREYWRHLSRREMLVWEAEGWTSRGSLDDWPTPSSVLGVIEERLQCLSPASRRLIGAAAVLGRQFDPRVLADVIAFDERDLDEAVQASLIAPLGNRSKGYGFTHRVIMERLYAGLDPGERAELHRRIGAVIERVHESEIEPHLSEIAHHLAAGIDDASADRAISYAERAADRAYEMLAFRESALRFEQALAALDRFRPDWHQRRWVLLSGLAEAAIGAGKVERARQAYAEAVASARRAGSGLSLVTAEPASSETGIEVMRVQSYMRAALNLPTLASQGWGGEADPERQQSLRLAVRRAREAGDLQALLNTLLACRWSLFGGAVLSEWLPLSTEAVLLAEQLGNRPALQEARLLRAHDLLSSGRVAEADEEIASVGRAADRQEPLFEWAAAYMQATRATMDGRFADAERLALEAFTTGAQAMAEVAQATYGTQLMAIRILQGRMEEVAAVLEPFVALYPAQDAGHTALANLYCELGRLTEAERELDLLEDTLFNERQPRGVLWLGTVAGVARACARLGGARRASLLYDQLLAYADYCIVVPIAVAFNGPVSMFLALLAETAGKRREAARYFEQTMATCEQLGVRPTLAHAQYEYARVLVARQGPANRRKALALLDEAEQTAWELDMPGFAQWIERLRSETGGGER